MVLQARRRSLPSGKFGGVICLHFNPRDGVRCNRAAGEGVFCYHHTSDWSRLPEEEQVKFNELLTNPAFAHDAAQWDSVYEQYHASKAAADQAAAVSSAADYAASAYERAAAAQAAQADMIERARQRVQGALRGAPGFFAHRAPLTPAAAAAPRATPLRLGGTMAQLLLSDKAETSSGAIAVRRGA